MPGMLTQRGRDAQSQDLGGYQGGGHGQGEHQGIALHRFHAPRGLGKSRIETASAAGLQRGNR